MSYMPPGDPPAYSANPSAPMYPNLPPQSYQQQYYVPPQPAGAHHKPPAYNPSGYQPLPGDVYPQPYQQPVIVTAPVINHESIIFVGGCPACRVGVLEDDYSCLAICCAILFFPIGLLCCLALKEKRCSNCGVVLG